MQLSPYADAALLDLLAALKAQGYSFTTVTPATHQRVLDRAPGAKARDLRDIFGWSRPFARGTLPSDLLVLLERAGALETSGSLLKSKLRVSSLDDRLYCHSAYPTAAEDSVFFGPDTYRFVAFVQGELARLPLVRRVVDIGTGSGAGGLAVAPLLPGAHVTLADINPTALRLAAINARHNRVEAELVRSKGLEKVEGPIDLVIANPPFIMDGQARDYRDGGDLNGARLSLDWSLEAARRLDAGGHMLLYTGAAIVHGQDALRDALEKELPALGCTLGYRELDPDIFGEELEKPAYADVERIAAIGAVISSPLPPSRERVG